MLRRKLRSLLTLSLTVSLLLPCTSQAAGAITTVTYKNNVKMATLTDSLMKKISTSTPEESASSDLAVVHPATRISTRRLPQSYTFDGTYYYYLSNEANTGSRKNNLRLTKVRYNEDGTYKESYMILEGFGHGTGIDCAVVNGKTYLWCVSDNQNSISVFRYKKGKVLKKHAKTHYRIRISGTTKNATSISPAVDPTGKILVVRFKRNGKAWYQYYKLKDGKTINPKNAYKTVKLSIPSSVFQGFDIAGNTIYTVEGSRSKSECKEIGETYHPIRVRTYNTKTKESTKKTITGAAKLLHREPEGIRVTSDGGIYLNICSHYKDLYTCVNVYQVK